MPFFFKKKNDFYFLVIGFWFGIIDFSIHMPIAILNTYENEEEERSSIYKNALFHHYFS